MPSFFKSAFHVTSLSKSLYSSIVQVTLLRYDPFVYLLEKKTIVQVYSLNL